MMNNTGYTTIKADYIFNPASDDPVKRYILVNNGIIENISDSPPVYNGMRQLDFTGYAISPFFCDYHLHFSERALASSGKIAGTLLQNGINKVFEGGDCHLSGLEMKKLLRDKLEVKTAGYAIYKKGTYGKFIGRGVEGPGEARVLIDKLCEHGVDYIKIINSGIFKPETATVTPGGFEKKELAEIVGYARERGLDIFCHANGAGKIHDAVSAGVSVIIHGLYVSDETLAMMAEKKVGFIPTANAFAGLSGTTKGRAIQMNIDRAVEKHLPAIKKASDRGVKVLPGTDSGPHFIPYGKAYRSELRLFKNAGLPVERILSSACADQITEGMRADFLILDGLEIKKVFISGECLEDMDDDS